jgi:nucleoside-diphosphate-sugar epimerase
VTTVLVAGATGAVGSALVPHLRAKGFSVIPHVRPKTAERHPLGKDPDALVIDLSDAPKLDAAISRAQAVVCAVGTMRRRFAAGDTYESSDCRPVVQLVESAKRAGQSPHFALVSSLGAPGLGIPGLEVQGGGGSPAERAALGHPPALDSRLDPLRLAGERRHAAARPAAHRPGAAPRGTRARAARSH